MILLASISEGSEESECILENFYLTCDQNVGTLVKNTKIHKNRYATHQAKSLLAPADSSCLERESCGNAGTEHGADRQDRDRVPPRGHDGSNHVTRINSFKERVNEIPGANIFLSSLHRTGSRTKVKRLVFERDDQFRAKFLGQIRKVNKSGVTRAASH